MAKARILISGDLHIASSGKKRRSKKETELWKRLAQGDRDAYRELHAKYAL